MDIAFHTVTGVIGFAALVAQDQELAAVGFVAGSVLPDLDVLLMAGGKRFYLRHHQGLTHTLVSAPVAAALLTALAAPLLDWQWSLFLGILLGLGCHLLLDVCNTLGVQWLWPFTKHRLRLDAVFFVDAVAWGIALACFGLIYLKAAPAGAVALAYAVALGGYLMAKLVLQRRARSRTGADIAIPSALNPFGFLLFRRRDGRLWTALYDAWRGRPTREHEQPEAPPAMQAMAERSRVFRELRAILRAPQITRVEASDTGTRLLIEDLAVRNFGGRFGRMELEFDAEGRLAHEMAHI